MPTYRGHFFLLKSRHSKKINTCAKTNQEDCPHKSDARPNNKDTRHKVIESWDYVYNISANLFFLHKICNFELD